MPFLEFPDHVYFNWNLLQQQKFQSYRWGLSRKGSQTTSQLDICSICDIWIICNSVIKMPPFYPRTNNNGLKNNNCVVQESKCWNNSWNSKEGQKIIARVCAQKFWKLKNLSNHSGYNCWITLITNSNYDLLTRLQGLVCTWSCIKVKALYFG